MAATEPSGAPWDLYREIHKGLRLALFTTTVKAGSADPTNDAEVLALEDEWRDTALVLQRHHYHEDSFVDPLIDKHASHVRSNIDQDHATIEQGLNELDAQATELAESTAGERRTRLRRFYLDLSRFTAIYLDHMTYEEEVVMPELHAVLTEDELADVTAKIRGGVPPAEMCIFLRYMLPGMNMNERTNMLGGIYANAPADTFELFRHAARAALSPAEYGAVAARASFA